MFCAPALRAGARLRVRAFGADPRDCRSFGNLINYFLILPPKLF
jgi:hypothetical protein